MLAVVVSRADSASAHVGERLLDLADWATVEDDTRPDAEGGGTVYRTDGIELREFEDLHLELDGVADAFDDPDLLVFASRHAGDTGRLLTAHHTGSFGPAEYGGEDRRLARACPNAHSRVVAALREHAPEEYDVGVECTHHGPSAVGAPSMFVEVGSDEPQWDDADAARAVARAILSLRDVSPDAPVEDGTRRHLVGFGGGHYAPRFERIVRETDWAVGHVGADWALHAMGDPEENRDVVRRAFEESAATHAVVDGDRPDLEGVIADLGYRVVSETWVRETDGVALSLVDDLADALCPVSEGLRFGERASEFAERADADGGASDASGVDRGTSGGDFDVIDLPVELLAEARGIDPDAVREAVERATVAFETTESGTRVADRAAVVDSGDRDALVDELAAVLDRSYETVERTDDAVVAREEAFEPERARTLGVTDGPKLGRLAEGKPVTVDGKTIEPAVVFVERERRFPLDAADE